MKRITLLLLLLVILLLTGISSAHHNDDHDNGRKKTPTPTATVVAKATHTPTPTAVPTVTSTPVTPTATPSAPATPYPDAPLCLDSGGMHDTTIFHTLWNAERGCHYDHEHGQDPFIPEVEAAFPGFDLFALLGGVEIGHTNPSSPMENTHKHGGMKWNVQLQHPEECAPFEASVHGVNGSVIQFHGFGDYGVELESAQHSTVAVLRLCNSADPGDYGYIFLNQLQTYGQIVVPYQGTVMPYPYYSVPLYPGGFGQYLTIDCIGDVIQCRPSRQFVLDRRLPAASNWTSKITGSGIRPEGSTLFNLLWRVRDAYRLFDWNDQEYPYTFVWLCSADDGATYNPTACRYNNSTTQVHEIAGTIPASWDNLVGFDTNPTVGRITAEGYTTRFGALNTACTAPATDCHPIKMVNAFVGKYGSVLVYTVGKNPNIVPYLPERDVFFCNGLPCSETDSGAVPSGWIGAEN